LSLHSKQGQTRQAESPDDLGCAALSGAVTYAPYV
jgi:hypothetical protein